MSDKRRQQILLVLLLVVLIAVVWWRLGPRLVDGRDGRSGAPGVAFARSSKPETREPLPEVVDLRLDDLQAASNDLARGRDPFNASRPEPAPPPEPDPSQTALQQAMERARLAAAAEEVSTRVAAARPTPPPVDVVFLGSFGPDRNRFAVFSDGNEIFNAGEGDVLKDKFVVMRIGFESADLGFVGFPEAPAQRLEIGG